MNVLAARSRTLPGMLERGALQFGDRPLASFPDAQWSHRQARDVAARRGAKLRAAGIARGDRVAILSSNRAGLLEVFLACGWIGAIAVPINAAAMRPQIEYYLANSGAKLLVAERHFLDRLPKVERLWPMEEMPPPGGEPIEAEKIEPGDTLAILYTSGTTGPAKGVTCPHAQYYWWGVNTASILGIGADDLLCTTLPLFHINALNTFAQASLAGCCAAFEPRFSASEFWPTVAARRATVIYLLGAMVPMLLAQKAHPLEHSHRVRIGLGPGVPAAALEDFRARTGIKLIEGYGSTETNFVIATTPDTPFRGVMGWVRPGFEACVVDEQDTQLPAGQAGELVLRADEPFAFATGYFDMPERTVEARRNLWFHTGDRVVREADGAFRFVDRIKDAIRRRGENISSYEVEQAVLRHPSIADCAAVAAPAQFEAGEDEVALFVVPAPGAALTVDDVSAWCDQRLPAFARPQTIRLLDELPYTPSGKVRKVELRELLGAA